MYYACSIANYVIYVVVVIITNNINSRAPKPTFTKSITCTNHSILRGLTSSSGEGLSLKGPVYFLYIGPRYL